MSELNRQDAEASEVRHDEPDDALDALAHQVIGAAIAVHRELGPGFLESVYESALCIELTERGIPFVRQAMLRVYYHGQEVGEGRIDLWVANRLVVELKAVEKLAPIHRAQLLSYLRATRMRLGLLINFNEPVLKDGLARIINTR